MRNWYQSIYYGDIKALISHEEKSFKLIRHAVINHQPEMMIELGTAYYGLTLLLHECDRSIPLYTFDKYCGRSWLSKAKHRISRDDADFIFRNAFNDNVTFIIGDVIHQSSPIVASLAEKPIKKLLYCDNGKKEKEMELYGPLLNKGDLMGVHDWLLEVDPDKMGHVLDQFEEHEVNKEMEEKGLLTRFFIKR